MLSRHFCRAVQNPVWRQRTTSTDISSSVPSDFTFYAIAHCTDNFVSSVSTWIRKLHPISYLCVTQRQAFWPISVLRSKRGFKLFMGRVSLPNCKSDWKIHSSSCTHGCGHKHTTKQRKCRPVGSNKTTRNAPLPNMDTLGDQRKYIWYILRRKDFPAWEAVQLELTASTELE